MAATVEARTRRPTAFMARRFALCSTLALKCKRTHTRSMIMKSPMCHGGSGGASTYAAPVSLELGPVYADATAGAAYGAPSASPGMRGASGRMGRSGRCKTDPSAHVSEQPVVVHVPLPDLDRPIVAHLDANHQIVSTRDEPGGVPTRI